MNARYKVLLPIAAIALIGLAGSSAAFAQAQPPVKSGGPVAANGPPGPSPLKCDPTEKVFQVQNGINDNFAGTGTVDPLPHPSGIPGLNAANIYDQTASNYHFGDSFSLSQPGMTITKIRLTTRLKANSGDANNDGISFSTKTPFTPGHFSYSLNTLVPGWAAAGAKLFTFEFLQSGTVNVNAGGTLFSLPGGTNFFADLNGSSNQPLHMYVQDDTSVDFIQIEGCYKPAPPKYNLVASKKHEGAVYTLDVTNAGSPISPSGKIEVVEIVPTGLTINGFSAPSPWTCSGTFPVVGPDAFTCSYPINAVIPAGQHLPQIVLKATGTPECPNCMKAKLYLKSVSDGVKPVEEEDMKNNASCTK